MASLVGQQLKDTYDSLLKTSDNDALGGTYKEITDGSGNGSNLYLGTGGNVGIGNTSPDAFLHIGGSIPTSAESLNVRGNSSSTYVVSIEQDNSTGYGVLIDTDGTLVSEPALNVENSSGSMLWVGSNGNVGIGTSSPTVPLEVDGELRVNSATARLVNGSGESKFIIDSATDSDAIIQFKESGGNRFTIGVDGSDADKFKFGVLSDLTTTTALTIDSSGNVGIGTDSPAANMDIKIPSVTNTETDVLRITDGVLCDLKLKLNRQSTLSTGIAVINTAAGNMAFETSNTEAMRIDSSGNVLVGKTTTGLATVGHQLNNDGAAFHTKSSNTVMFLNRTTSDGTIVDLRKDNTTVGSINSYAGTRLGIGSNSVTGIVFGSVDVLPATSGTTLADDTYSIGNNSFRWDNIYATNGTIQTSDVNEKQDIEELNDAELRVAQKAKTLLRKYRWKSSVESKGDEARIHFGIIAQDLEQAFDDEGLDAGRYGMFIKSTWTNEDGEEQTRLGVRYNQLLAFIISAL